MDLHAAARRWVAADPDPTTRTQLQAILDADDRDALAAGFGARLEFGTAGIRGPMGPGPARMNRLVVRRVTAGLAARLLEGDVDARRGVVVGHDARHNSEQFADDVATVLSGFGIPVHRLRGLTPTPVVAFAVRDLEAAAGVQITASHNPAADNGYKVYWADGAQIIPPLDAEISAAIDAVDPHATLPSSHEHVRDVGDEVEERYVAATLALQCEPGLRDLTIVFTPLHGVAGPLVQRLLADAGFSRVACVAEQLHPDPAFSTVAFPNPEEPGALDLAIRLAAESDADLILANDPDGDRIAAAVPDGGGWRPLSGDEIGCLLAEWLLTRAGGGAERVVGTTVVSSRMLAAMAAHHGVGYVETLTGFKWLARAALDEAGVGGRMVLAYEQALGVMCGTAVLDKDGMSAAVVLADMAAALRAEGRTLLDVLDDLARRHGVHVTGGHNVRLEGEDGLGLVTETLERLRQAPPSEVGGVAVVEVADHIAGTRTRAGADPVPLSTPPTDLVGLALADGSRLQVRPSGTEPLLKFYVEVIEPVGEGEAVGSVRRRAEQRQAALADSFLRVAGV